MVDHVHVVRGGEGAADAVDLARERLVRDRERRLPDHRELGEDVGHRPVAICAGIEEHHNSLAAIDQLAERRPL